VAAPSTTPKEIEMTTSSKTLAEDWRILRDKETCPYRLTPFVGSHDHDEWSEKDGSRVLIVELAPGMTFNSVAHLHEALESFFDLALGTVRMEPIQEKARRVRITIAKSPSETAPA
jgi:DNA/RNA-binding domain of Phe-tRNA-synthetase-like protein